MLGSSKTPWRYVGIFVRLGRNARICVKLGRNVRNFAKLGRKARMDVRLAGNAWTCTKLGGNSCISGRRGDILRIFLKLGGNTRFFVESAGSARILAKPRWECLHLYETGSECSRLSGIVGRKVPISVKLCGNVRILPGLGATARMCSRRAGICAKCRGNGCVFVKRGRNGRIVVKVGVSVELCANVWLCAKLGTDGDMFGKLLLRLLGRWQCWRFFRVAHGQPIVKRGFGTRSPHETRAFDVVCGDWDRR